MKRSFILMASLFVLFSCAKEEFAINKGNQSGSINPIISTSTQLCSQHTLVSPKVDILMLWDNSSSFNFVNSSTKKAMGNLIASVSENFDYHILSLPLIPANTTNALFEGILVVKDPTSVSGGASSILKTKDQAVASLAFTQGPGGNERGVDRATDVLLNNRANGIFRNDAYTIIVVMSNEDDKGCEATTGYASCSTYDINQYLEPKINKLLCLRGNTAVNCSATGITSPLNSAMMRYINISPLTQCTNGLNKVNTRYRKVAKTLYESSYTNGWPTANDHISQDVTGAPDSYDLCRIDFDHIFDGVNSAIKQTLIKHVYDYWPVAGSNTSIDPDTIRVVRSDGKILQNRALDGSITNGYEYVGDQVARNTRTLPTPGEPFTGKMIRLYGVNGDDKIVYPDCLTISFDEEKKQYGYIYLSNTSPNVSTIEVRINGNIVPQSSTNGWDYMGLQFINSSNSSIDPNLKIALLPPGAPSGYLLRLNGSYKITNSGSSVPISVFFNSASQ